MISNNENIEILKVARKKKIDIQTEDEFQSNLKEILNGGKLEKSKAGIKLNLGKGLKLAIKKNGDKYFIYEFSINGQQKSKSIGKYPHISFCAAIEKSKYLKNEVSKAKEIKSKKLFIEKINEKLTNKKTSRNKKISRNSNDLKQLFNLLKNEIFNNLNEKEKIEIYFAITLLLLFPYENVDFTMLKYDDFLQNTFLKSYGIRPLFQDFTNKFGINSKNIILSKHPDLQDSLEIFLDRLDEISGKNREYLIPRLKNLSNVEVNKLLSIHLSNLTQPSHVTLKDLLLFCKNYIYEHSGFSKTFIDEFAKNSQPNNDFDHFYEPQYRAIREWWFARLVTSNR